MLAALNGGLEGGTSRPPSPPKSVPRTGVGGGGEAYSSSAIPTRETVRFWVGRVCGRCKEKDGIRTEEKICTLGCCCCKGARVRAFTRHVNVLYFPPLLHGKEYEKSPTKTYEEACGVRKLMWSCNDSVLKN